MAVKGKTMKRSPISGLILAVAAVAGSCRAADAAAETAAPGWKEVPFVETAPEPSLTAEEKARGFLLFTRPITEIVYANTWPRGEERVAALVAFATPGEFEPLNFALHAVKPLNKVTLTVSALTSAAGEIPAAALDVRYLRYYDIRYPSYTSKDTFRRMPELLEHFDPLSIPAHESHRFWITVHVPDATAPGLYQGSVALQADGLTEPVNLPIEFRVLGFRLLKDPAKHFSAYNYDFTSKAKSTFAELPPEITGDEARINQVAADEYCTMVDYGFDVPPTGYIAYDEKRDALYYRPESALENMKKSGLLKGACFMVSMDAAMPTLIRKYTGADAPKHYALKSPPPPEFYAKVTALVQAFAADWKTRGLPEIIYGPLDEVDSSAWEFGSCTYQAVKAAGVRTFATKDPKASDAMHYRPYLDVWVSQPFSVPYGEVIKDQRYSYWCYPNHVACEQRVPEIMCKGGRMTYGFGFWRSGYVGLVPWIWRWDMGQSGSRHYLDLDGGGRSISGCGNKIGADGKVIPAVYWECFREGYDDGRYLYTLQQAIAEREQSPDPACAKAVTQAKALLQETWNAVVPQDRYLADGMWPSVDFNLQRWRLALAIDSLLPFQKSSSVTAASVLVADPTGGSAPMATSPLDQAIRVGNLESRDLGDEEFPLWKNATCEGKTEVTAEPKHAGAKCLKWTVTMDYANDGEGQAPNPNGPYRKGWPRLGVDFAKGSLDLAHYDYLSFWLRVDSSRDEVADDSTPLRCEITAREGGRKLFDNLVVGAAPQRTWFRVVLPLADIVKANPGKVNDVSRIQLWLREGDFADQTTVVFYLDEIALIRFKTPVFGTVALPTALLLPTRSLAFDYDLLGAADIKAGEYRLRISVTDPAGQAVADVTREVDNDRHIVVPADTLKAAGTHDVRLDLVKGNQTVSSAVRRLRVMPGPVSFRPTGAK